MTTKERALLAIAGPIIVMAVLLLPFRDGIGIVVLLGGGLATVVQLVRIALGRGRRRTLKQFWSFFKDAFWGSG